MTVGWAVLAFRSKVLAICMSPRVCDHAGSYFGASQPEAEHIAGPQNVCVCVSRTLMLAPDGGFHGSARPRLRQWSVPASTLKCPIAWSGRWRRLMRRSSSEALAAPRRHLLQV